MEAGWKLETGMNTLMEKTPQYLGKMKVERESTKGRKVQAQKRMGWKNEGVGVFTKMEGP